MLNHVVCILISVSYQLFNDQIIEITAIPSFKHRLHYDFLETCVESLSICHNIHTLILMTQHPVLMQIVRRRKHLHKLQLQLENISTLDAATFSQITGLHTLILHRAPLSICQRLTKWIVNVSDTLRTLIINVSCLPSTLLSQ